MSNRRVSRKGLRPPGPPGAEEGRQGHFAALPASERVPPLIFRLITRWRRLRSAALLSEGVSGCVTKTNSSLMCRSIRRHSLACGAVGSSRKGRHSFSNRLSRTNSPVPGGVSGRCPSPGPVVEPPHSVGPLRQHCILRVQRLQLVDVPQQVGPAPLLQSRVVVVGGVEVACQNPAKLLAQRLVHHLSAPAPAQEVPLRRCAEGPNVAVDSILPPASLVSVHYRAATDALQRFSDSRSAMPGNLMDGPDDGPNAQFQLVERSQIPLNCPYGQPPSSRRVTIRLTRLTPRRCRPTANPRRGAWGSRRFRHSGHSRAMKTCSVTSAGATGISMTSRVRCTHPPGQGGVAFRAGLRSVLHPAGGFRPPPGKAVGTPFSGALFSAADAPCQPACGPASCPLDRRRTAGLQALHPPPQSGIGVR